MKKTPAQLLPEKLIPQITWRRDQMFKEAYAPLIKDQRILEIAPNHCLFTDKMLTVGAKKITLVEFDSQACDLIKNYYQDDARIQMYQKDIHYLLKELPKEFDTVICAGFLYHTPHPFWILEGIANLGPQYILIDTACSLTEHILAVPELHNQQGYRQVENTNSGLSLRITPEIYFSVMIKLGYRPIAQLNTTPLPPMPNLTQEQLSILAAWNNTFSYWFEKI